MLVDLLDLCTVLHLLSYGPLADLSPCFPSPSCVILVSFLYITWTVCYIYMCIYIYWYARSIAKDVDCSIKYLEGVLLYTALSVSCGWFVEVNYFSPVVSLVLHLLESQRRMVATRPHGHSLTWPIVEATRPLS